MLEGGQSSVIKQRFFFFYLLLGVFSFTPFIFGGVLATVGKFGVRLGTEVATIILTLGAVLSLGSFLAQSKFFSKQYVSKIINQPKENQNLILQQNMNPEKALAVLAGMSPFEKSMLNLLSSQFIIFVIVLAVNESVSMMGLMLGMQDGGLYTYFPFGLAHLGLNYRVYLGLSNMRVFAKETYRGS